MLGDITHELNLTYKQKDEWQIKRNVTLTRSNPCLVAYKDCSWIDPFLLYLRVNYINGLCDLSDFIDLVLSYFFFTDPVIVV